ncbi:MAG: hypothetical protein LBO00_07215 [Zoogloeaceae bacterium]|jgi:hypothetical protein|nr:hypothetical protein [Zoogloeaceae bacterium]
MISKDLDLMIDEPAFSAPVEVWQEWLASLRAENDDHPAILRAIRLAENWIPKRIALDQEFPELRKAQAQEAQAA